MQNANGCEELDINMFIFDSCNCYEAVGILGGNLYLLWKWCFGWVRVRGLILSFFLFLLFAVSGYDGVWSFLDRKVGWGWEGGSTPSALTADRPCTATPTGRRSPEMCPPSRSTSSSSHSSLPSSSYSPESGKRWGREIKQCCALCTTLCVLSDFCTYKATPACSGEALLVLNPLLLFFFNLQWESLLSFLY